MVEGKRTIGRVKHRMILENHKRNRAATDPDESPKRCLYMTRLPEGGSRYKFRRMFERIFDLDVQSGSVRANGQKFAIVFGDVYRDYQVPLKAGIPYLLIEHDLATMRSGKESEAEREMVENAAALIVTSEGYLPHLAKRYTLPKATGVVHLRPVMRDLDFEPLPKLEGQHIAYAGGIMSENKADTPMGYRVLFEPFQALIDEGWTVHIYPAGKCTPYAKDYESIGCVVHKQVPPGALYRELSQYQAGFHGWGRTGAQEFVHACVPNKWYMYLGAGIPTLGFNVGDRVPYDGKWGCVHKRSWAATTRRILNMDIDPHTRIRQVMESDWPTFIEVSQALLDASEAGTCKQG